jgi:hypothetical protein
MDISSRLNPAGLRAELQRQQAELRSENVGGLLARAAEGLRPTGPAPVIPEEARRDE